MVEILRCDYKLSMLAYVKTDRGQEWHLTVGSPKARITSLTRRPGWGAVSGLCPQGVVVMGNGAWCRFCIWGQNRQSASMLLSICDRSQQSFLVKD